MFGSGSTTRLFLSSYVCLWIQTPHIFKSFLFILQQALPVDLSSNGIRNHGSGSFHGASAFDPCCPGSSSRTSIYGHQSGAAPSQPITIDGYSTNMVAQPQPQPPPPASLSSCQHYMPCKYSCWLWYELTGSTLPYLHICISNGIRSLGKVAWLATSLTLVMPWYYSESSFGVRAASGIAFGINFGSAGWIC